MIEIIVIGISALVALRLLGLLKEPNQGALLIVRTE